MSDRDTLESEYLALKLAEDYWRAESSLSHFIRAAWHVLEPGREYLHNWHVDCIADHLEAVKAGEIRKLIINMPPRSMKSISVTVCFPVWLWITDPGKRFFSASYAESLAIKHNVDRREIIRSKWFQSVWGDRFKLSDDQDQKSLFKNDHRGQMYATSVGGGGTGEGGDIIIIDDPVNPKMAASDTLRDHANTWRDGTVTTRKNDKKKSAEIIVMQRLHQKDLTGHVLSKVDDPEPWTHLCLEGQSTSNKVYSFPHSGRKVEVKEGEYLHPDREGEKEHKQARVDLGELGYLSQYQQDPRISTEGFFQRSWWKRYKALPLDRNRRVMFIDCAEKPGISTDYTVMSVWDETSTGFNLVDVWRKRVAFPELKAAAIDNFNAHKPDSVVIEDKSAGVQLIQELKAKTSLPVIEYNPGSRDKVVRASGATPTVEAGNCYLPADRPWVELFISEHEKFPNDDHDDQVDTTSMMVEYFRGSAQQPRIRDL